MKKIVWISAYLPYDTVKHAGGKIHNYYLKKLIESGTYDIRLISFYVPGEENNFTIGDRIKCDLVCYYNGIRKIIRGLGEIPFKYNPFNRYGGMANHYSIKNILRILRDYKNEGFYPDIVILQWTQIVVYAEYIKKIFPDTKIVSIEEDFSVLGYQRKRDRENNGLKRFIWNNRCKNLEKAEIGALRLSDLIIMNNAKDADLLKKYKQDLPIRIWSPYYDDYLDVNRKEPLSRSIIFYGDMSRPENYLSAIWFIENVMSRLNDTDINYHIIGGRPYSGLQQYKSERVVICGFVPDVREEFSKALCLAAPLQLGAGIKIKILESMSAGLPVITNNIGIEGIEATDGKEYFYAQTAEEYENIIRGMIENRYNLKEISDEGRKLIKEKYNYEKSSADFVCWLGEL